MNICVFITGTNAVGKSTLAEELIRLHGGISNLSDKISYCSDGYTSFAGVYEKKRKFCGVDAFGNTKCLKDVVEKALNKTSIVFCEGFYLHTAGKNLTDAIFLAQKQLVVFLYAPVKEIDRRLYQRSQRHVTEAVWKTQKSCANALRKWHDMGCPVMSFDTSKVAVSDIAMAVEEKVKVLTSK